MENNSDQDNQQETNTGPRGTGISRREGLEQHLAGQAVTSPDPSGTASGAALIGVQGAFKGRRFVVPHGRSTLGRDNQNELVIIDDSVSLVHARLVEKDGHYRVLNLLSTNDTRVNDEKVSDSPIRDGDAVCFGEVEFIFQQVNPPSASRFGELLITLRRWLGL